MNKSIVLLLLNLWLYKEPVTSSSVTRQISGEVKLFQAPAAFDVETTLLLNDIIKKDKEVGYKIKARLNLVPVWSNQDNEFLLKFQLLGPQLHLRGKHQNADYTAHNSIWDSYSDSSYYMHWKNGLIENLYLNQKEPLDIVNYKKSLSSLFQFQIIDGEYNETDISGSCNILYESVSTNVFRKIKRRCSGEEGVSTRRVVRYTLAAGGGALEQVYGDEVVEVGEPSLGVKARSWHRLQAVMPSAPAPASPQPSLEAALLALPAGLHAEPLQLIEADDSNEDMDVAGLVSRHRSQLESGAAGAGGGAALAAAALELLPALQAADEQQLRALLHDPRNYDSLGELCRLLGAAGTGAAHAAAAGFLHLAASDPLQPLAAAYLAGAAVAPRPAVAELTRLWEEARAPAVAGAALAAAARAQPALRDVIARDLHKCKDEECLWWRVQALGALRRGDAAPALLHHAATGTRQLATAALQGLALLPPSELHYERRQRLQKIALQAGRPLEVRAAALDLLLVSSAARPVPLADLAAALHRHGPAELKRLFWDRLHQLAEEHEAVRDFLPMLDPSLKTWHAQSHAGTSSVLVRETGWDVAGWGGWDARLESVQVAAAGLLRRGRVRLLLRGPGAVHEELAVEVWTRGLEAVAGGDAADPQLYEADDSDQEVAGGLGLAVAGMPLPRLQLFRGQAQLLAHVWAGAGSEPTPVLRALRPLPTLSGRLPTLAGVVLRYHWRAAVALALDAQAQVSLWSRSARSALELRAGVAGAAGARVQAAWGALSANCSVSAEPRLRIEADLDFYDAVALCVRVRIDDYNYDRESRLQSVQGARRLRVRRGRAERRARAGRTLSLGARSDAACRALGAQH